LNAPVRQEAVHDMIQSVNPKLICLQEMKLSVITSQITAETLGHCFNGYEYVPANNARGGIMVGWHFNFMVTSDMLLKCFSLSMTVRPTFEVSPFLLIVVYGLVEDTEKADFLDELLSIAPISQMQWVVLGDFNMIYEAMDKNNLNMNRQLLGRFSVNSLSSPFITVGTLGAMTEPNQHWFILIESFATRIGI
jgi:exonuclease III